MEFLILCAILYITYKVCQTRFDFSFSSRNNTYHVKVCYLFQNDFLPILNALHYSINRDFDIHNHTLVISHETATVTVVSNANDDVFKSELYVIAMEIEHYIKINRTDHTNYI